MRFLSLFLVVAAVLYFALVVSAGEPEGKKKSASEQTETNRIVFKMSTLEHERALEKLYEDSDSDSSTNAIQRLYGKAKALASAARKPPVSSSSFRGSGNPNLANTVTQLA